MSNTPTFRDVSFIPDPEALALNRLRDIALYISTFFDFMLAADEVHLSVLADDQCFLSFTEYHYSTSQEVGLKRLAKRLGRRYFWVAPSIYVTARNYGGVPRASISFSLDRDTANHFRNVAARIGSKPCLSDLFENLSSYMKEKYKDCFSQEVPCPCLPSLINS